MTAATATAARTLEVGDILASQWGYEQTNVCFYEVIKASRFFVTVREISALSMPTGWAQDLKAPRPGSYIGEPMRRKVKDYSIAKDSPYIEIKSFELARLWDGRPTEATSWY